MRLPKTLNVQVGRKLADKSKVEIRKEAIRVFKTYGVVAVQLMYDVVRVTFKTLDGFQAAKRLDGVRLFGLWCSILGGGPPLTIVHVFDYPFEEADALVSNAFMDFGEVKKVKDQLSIADPEIYTGTRLVSLVLKANPPRSLLIGGYLCRVWYKGQPLVCNLCGVQGHKSANCPNRDKCRLCGESGHFARQCRNAWGRNPQAPAVNVEPSVVSEDPPVSVTAPQATADASALEDAEEDFHDAFSDDIDQFSSSGDPSSLEISSFPSGSQSILREIDPQSAVQAEVVVVEGDGVSSEHEVSVATSDAVLSKPSQSSFCSGPSDASMDLSVCRKRKDRPLPELSRTFSADDLAVRQGRKALKTPAPRPGHHSRLPAAVSGRPSGLPVRTTALPVRVGSRPPRT